MESIQQTPQAPEAGPAGTLSLAGRFVAVFARPTQAWVGLDRRGQWWFPLLLSVLVAVVGTALTYERAMVPTILAQMEAKVETGEVPAQALDRIEAQVSGPVAKVVQVGSLVVVLPLVTLAVALIPWIAAGFMLGRRFRFRDAFAVTCWAGLVALPNQILTSILAWTNESMRNLHTGFGVLLPVEDPPSKLMVGLGSFLDNGIGPLTLWYVAVLGLGTAALSGAPRRPAMLAVGGLWLAGAAIFSVVGGFLAPGA